MIQGWHSKELIVGICSILVKVYSKFNTSVHVCGQYLFFWWTACLVVISKAFERDEEYPKGKLHYLYIMEIFFQNFNLLLSNCNHFIFNWLQTIDLCCWFQSILICYIVHGSNFWWHFSYHIRPFDKVCFMYA